MHRAAQFHRACGPGFPAMTGRRRHWGGPGGGFGYADGPRARRGDVRAAILALLAEEARNGYQIIQEIGERTKGLWKPSPGAVYPALGLLTDEGLVREVDVDGKRAFELTDQGRAHIAESDPGKPWETVLEGMPEGELNLREQIPQIAMALRQIAMGGDPEQVAKAKAVLDETRRSLYRILAGD